MRRARNLRPSEYRAIGDLANALKAAPVRIYRETVDKRTGRVTREQPSELPWYSLALNRLWKADPPLAQNELWTLLRALAPEERWRSRMEVQPHAQRPRP